MATAGRDHNHYGFTVWIAGGGVRSGTVHGSTDDFGFKAQEHPTSEHDLHATTLHLMGFPVAAKRSFACLEACPT